MQLKQVPGRVWSGTGLLVLGRLWRSACTLITLYLLVHQLAPADFGRFTFYLAIFMLLDSLADMGTAHATVQWTAEHPERVPAVLRVARRLRLGTASLGILIVSASAFAVGEQGAWLIILASCYPLTHALELSNLVFRNQIAWGRPVLIRAVAAGLSLGMTILLIVLDVRSPAAFLLASASGSIVGNLLQHLVARGHLPTTPGPPIDWRRFLMSALPMGIAGLCQQAYFYVDNLFVRAWIDDTALGHYNIAVRVMSYAIMVAVFAPLAALPWLTREHAAGRLGPAVSNIAQPLFALAGLGTGLLWPFSEALLALFGQDFVAAAPSLRWLLVACAVVYVGAPLLTGVVASGRSGGVLRIAAAALALNLIGNTLLVPRLGMEGAAIATCATELSVALGAAWTLARAGAPIPLGNRAWGWLVGPALFVAGRALSQLLLP